MVVGYQHWSPTVNLGSLGSGFTDFFNVHPENWGNDPSLTDNFSVGLKQATSKWLCLYLQNVKPHCKLFCFRFSKF